MILKNKTKDSLFWIYPLIILGLLILAIRRDEHMRDSAAQTNIKVDTSVISSSKTEMVDTLQTEDRIL